MDWEFIQIWERPCHQLQQHSQSEGVTAVVHQSWPCPPKVKVQEVVTAIPRKSRDSARSNLAASLEQLPFQEALFKTLHPNPSTLRKMSKLATLHLRPQSLHLLHPSITPRVGHQGLRQAASITGWWEVWGTVEDLGFRLEACRFPWGLSFKLWI